MRRPLEMQTHKAIPIPQYAPKFEAEYSRGKRVDPDAERNEAAKIKALYKKERKGAIRELRKDAKFLAVERNKERKEKDIEYEKRMRSVTGSITTTERAEEKAAERLVNRHHRRLGFGISDRTDFCVLCNSQRKGSRQAKRRTELDGILFGTLYHKHVVFYLISVCIAFEGIGIARLALVDNFTRLMLVITLRKAQSRDSVIAQKLDAELSESKRIEQQRQKGQTERSSDLVHLVVYKITFV